MKKILTVFFLLFSMFLRVYALNEYSVPNVDYCYGDGFAGARYCGTTNEISGYEVFSNRWQSCITDKCIGLQRFSGKLSKRQSRLISFALNQYDLQVGEIYSVGIYEISNLNYRIGITCEITAVNSDGSYSYSWWGFSYYQE